ncbi:MAG: hypothetical protein KDA44_20485, partial [Planctomycetales bacterium]|nr:hypothetical protein [Planctomycetales bacterium]
MTYFAPHRGLALLPSLLVLSAWGAAARADITSQGDISPALPIAGGSVSNPIIGNTSFGTATINGGTSLTGTTGSLGDKSTGLGDLTITGFGSIWDLSSTLTVGNSGAGRIQVNQGGRLQNNQLIVGNNSGAAGWVSIDGFGTVWESG